MSNNSTEVFYFDGFRLDCFSLYRLAQAGAVEPIALGSRALELLLILVKRQGDIVLRDEIMDAVWPDIAMRGGDLTVQIFTLRRVLDKNRANGSCIQAIPGRGYRFVPQVSLTASGNCRL
jgi:adenylate cyclase